MPSPVFRLGYAAALVGPWTWGAYDKAVQVPPNYYCKLELQDNAGVDVIWVRFVHADLDTLGAGYPAITVDQATKTATWQHPNAKGRTLDVQATINQGALNGVAQPSYIRSLQSHSVTESGEVRPAVGETDEANRTSGWTVKLDDAVKQSHGELFVAHVGTIDTTDATVTPVVTIPAPTADAVYNIAAYVTAQTTAGAHNAAAYLILGTFKWNQALGSWTAVGALTSALAVEDVAAWDCTIAIDGTNLKVNCTGAAATDITWTASVEVRRVGG